MLSAIFAHGTLKQRDKDRAATTLPDPSSYLPRPGASPAGAAPSPRSVVAPSASAASAGAASSPRSVASAPAATGPIDRFAAASSRSRSAPALGRSMAMTLPLVRARSGPRFSPSSAQRCLTAINDLAQQAAPRLPRVSSFEDFENNFF